MMAVDRLGFACVALGALLLVPNAAAAQQPQASATDQAALAEAGRDEERILELVNTSRFYDAEPLALRLYELRQRLLGPDSGYTIDAANYLGMIYRGQQRYDEAEPLLDRVLAWWERRAPGDRGERSAVLNLVQLYERQGSISGADQEALLRRALALCDRILGPDDDDTLRALIGLRVYYDGQRRWTDAEPLHLRLLERQRRVYGPGHEFVANQEHSIAWFYRNAGRDRDAEQHYLAAITINQRRGGPTHINTRQSVNALLSFYLERGRRDDARALAARYPEAPAAAPAQAVAAAPAPPPPPAELARQTAEQRATDEYLRRSREVNDLNTQVQQLIGEGRFAEAEPVALRAYEAAQAMGDSAVADPLDRLVQVYIALGRFGEAEPLARRAYGEQQRLEAAQTYWGRGRLNTAYQLAQVYRAQGRFEEAEALFTQVNREARGDFLGARALNRIVEMILQRGEFARAEQFARVVFEGFQSSPMVPGDEIQVAAFIWAAALSGLGRDSEAEPLLRSVLAHRERVYGAQHPSTLDAARVLAQSLVRQRRFADAVTLLRRSAEGSEQTLGRDHPATLGNLNDLSLALLADRRTAGTALEPARHLVENVRQGRVGGSAARPSVGTPTTPDQTEGGAAAYFTLFADAAWANAGTRTDQRAALLPDVFSALQDSLAGTAARSITEQAARRYADGRDPALGSIIEERARLQAQWVELNTRLTDLYSPANAASADEARPAELRRQLDAARTRIEAIDARLRTEAPDYFALIEPQSIDVDAARALVGPDEAILVVVPTAFGTHLMAVTREGIVWQRSDWNAARIRGAVQQLRWDAGARVSGSNAELASLRGTRAETAPPIFHRAVAHQLYQQLIVPVLPSLAGKTRLFVAAGGSLAGLPFSLLVSAPPPAGADDDPASLRATRWFADDFQLTHIPSIQSLAILRRQQPPAAAPDRSFVGIGNPVLGPVATVRGYGTTRGLSSSQQVFARGRTRSGAPADMTMLRQMASLPGTAEELTRVRMAVGADQSSVIEAQQATERNVRRVDFANRRLVLFSTHGLTAEEASGVGEPGLVLTPPPLTGAAADEYLATDPANDGYLAASEVTTLNMNADWVVLSACNTATGDDNANLSALARAFFYAGARNLLASHWPVSDLVAPLLITQTVAPAQSGLSRGAALQRAMLSIRTDAAHPEWAHPFYWAPFVLIGDGGR